MQRGRNHFDCPLLSLNWTDDAFNCVNAPWVLEFSVGGGEGGHSTCVCVCVCWSPPLLYFHGKHNSAVNSQLPKPFASKTIWTSLECASWMGITHYIYNINTFCLMRAECIPCKMINGDTGASLESALIPQPHSDCPFGLCSVPIGVASSCWWREFQLWPQIEFQHEMSLRFTSLLIRSWLAPIAHREKTFLSTIPRFVFFLSWPLRVSPDLKIALNI